MGSAAPQKGQYGHNCSIDIVLAIMVKLAIIAILVVMAWLNMVTDIVNSDFFVKRRMNIDHH